MIPDSPNVDITISGTGWSEAVAKTLQAYIDARYSELNDKIPESGNWEYTLKIKKVYSDESITSLLITQYEYMGWAHGSTSRLGLVLDTKTWKEIDISDIYNGQKLARRLSPIWQKQIRYTLEQSLGAKLTQDEKNWIRDGSNDIQQYQSYSITPKLLIIYGQEYQHNAYAYGTQTLIIPLSKIIDLKK